MFLLTGLSLSSSEDKTLNNDQWHRPALAPCYILTWIGIYLCFIVIFSIALNGSVIYTIVSKKYPRSPISIFMLALSISDLAHTLFGIPLPLTSNFACRWLYGKYLCYYEGFMAYFVGMIGLYLMTALSLNRYWLIVTPNQVKYVTFQSAYISVILSVLGGLFWAGVPILGWNSYTLEGALTTCSVQWQSRSINVVTYNMSMFIFAYIIPLIIMLYCNIKIYLEVRNISQRRLTWIKGKQVHHTSHRLSIDQHMAKTVFYIIFTFTIAWTPYAIAAFISSFVSADLIGPLGGTLPAIFAKSTVCFNPLIYILTNAQIRSQIPFLRNKSSKSSSGLSMKEKKNQSTSLQIELLKLSGDEEKTTIIKNHTNIH